MIDDGVEVGVSYNLGEDCFYNGLVFVTYSSDITFHKNEEDAFIEITKEIDNEVSAIDDFVNKKNIGFNEVTLNLFKNGAISINDDGSLHMAVSSEGYELDWNLSAMSNYVLDITVSKDLEIDDYATLTNSAQIKVSLPRPEPEVEEVPLHEKALEALSDFIKDVGDTVCDGIDVVSDWCNDNKEVVATVGVVAVTALAIWGSPYALSLLPSVCK